MSSAPQGTLRRAFVTAVRLSVAHHPLCHVFRADVFGRRLRVCSGCAVTWPAFFVTLWLVAVAPLRWGWDPLGMVAVGLALGLPQASTLLYRGGRVWRAVAKGVGGVGLALLLVGILWYPVAWAWKTAVWAGLAAAVAVFLALRARSILRTCDACPWARDWERCPGFAAEGNG